MVDKVELNCKIRQVADKYELADPALNQPGEDKAIYILEFIQFHLLCMDETYSISESLGFVISQ